MSKTTTTAQLHAWLSPHMRIEGLFDSAPERVLSALSYTTLGPDVTSYQKDNGYTYIGSATIRLEACTRDEIIGSKVDALKTEKAQVLATAQAKATEIDSQIQKLLAISFDGAKA